MGEEPEGRIISNSDASTATTALDRLHATSQRTWSHLELVQHAVQMANELDISDRTYHFRTYDCCFIGREAVDWMVDTGAVVDRVEALILGNYMIGVGLIHHVLNEHGFKDMNLFYRIHLVEQVPRMLGCKATPPLMQLEGGTATCSEKPFHDYETRCEQARIHAEGRRCGFLTCR
mmetsp:Transcript_1438/g.2879  ORF Transcript_1438/g.2879 Transcript_1438/m.2879 type:complete len:176 (-) Transcript_1438:412-939(-)|eukprot:CAMPEP_0118923998 /NCGR_PEP_ID=MMETSP1169-20130426/2325_1 /TAXON_ID=36882 /ORGANISM="Pyramimonas obovata, Strain CCMP722" /LENGTH=175 /DNA_ID=CAMNT_0006865073 /DNA_START=148 /DNA_END=675 /DNA_ORIENTATION=+